jgi:signal transduction histidine kinase
MGVIVNLDAGLSSPDLQTLAHHAEKAKETARIGIEETRRSIKALRAAALEGGSIATGLRTVIGSCMDNSAINWTLSITDGFPPLSETIEQELLRIVQEACTNVRKHSGSTKMRVSLDHTTQHVRLSIHDDGKGFDIRTPTEGFGLIGMNERARRVDAVLTVYSKVGEGTTVEVLLHTSNSNNS